MFNVSITTTLPLRVVALRHTGDYMNIGNAFERLSIWAAGQGLLAEGVRYFGIYYDDPAAKPASELVSDACLTIAETASVPNRLSWDIPSRARRKRIPMRLMFYRTF